MSGQTSSITATSAAPAAPCLWNARCTLGGTELDAEAPPLPGWPPRGNPLSRAPRRILSTVSPAAATPSGTVTLLFTDVEGSTRLWEAEPERMAPALRRHDEMLRRFKGFQLGSLKITNKLSLKIDNSRVWIFHGDVFDVTMKHSKWLTKLGSHGYDLLILINAFCNWVSEKMGRGKISLSKNIKNSVKKAVKFINDFEKTTADIAIDNGYDYVLCGHIHHPEMKTIVTEKGQVEYLNSGDWIENLTSLEYTDGKWTLFHYNENDFEKEEDETEDEIVAMSNDEIFNQMLADFRIKTFTTQIKIK